ncbi:MAG: hypothetical protein JO347_11015 [Candidatus Eremiobacteraeota bacterium]|nr:hypothetical protein [Candidatus Eremiobacteraeota bacterium]MBV8282576.1 hypothetical protein [Candidatus Eremiobacteraeota bacterium]
MLAQIDPRRFARFAFLNNVALALIPCVLVWLMPSPESLPEAYRSIDVDLTFFVRGLAWIVLPTLGLAFAFAAERAYQRANPAASGGTLAGLAVIVAAPIVLLVPLFIALTNAIVMHADVLRVIGRPAPFCLLMSGIYMALVFGAGLIVWSVGAAPQWVRAVVAWTLSFVVWVGGLGVFAWLMGYAHAWPR